MNQKILKLLEQLDEQLFANNTLTDDLLVTEANAIDITITILSQLKLLIVGYNFNSQEEEIHFFKHQKPQFISRLIYHHSIYHIELHKPIGGEVQMRAYFEKELLKLKHFFDANLEFYKYMRSDSEYLDHAYFLRGEPMMKLCQDLASYESDPQFCTSHGFILATTIANCQVEDYINLCLVNLDQMLVNMNGQIFSNQNPTWKRSKTSLIELIYALHYQGAIENSKSGLKGLIFFFESVFNIKLGNHYVTISEIKERKNGISKFLDSLKESFIRNIEDDNNI